MRDVRKMAEIWPLAAAVLDAGGCFRLWPSGQSMRPTLREGEDSVLLSRPTGLRRYDILLVQTPGGQFILHRAIRLTADSVTLAGDAHIAEEGPYPLSCVLARVDTIYRGEVQKNPRSRTAIFLAKLRHAKRILLTPFYRKKSRQK